jgi:hypothetical protein
VDEKLRGIAARRAALDAEEANLLRYAGELKLWRAFGFGSLLEYMERAMGYAPHTATERLRVSRLLGELPLIADALEKGELPHSAVRELSRVAVPETEEAWIEAARDKSLREIEAMVSGHKAGDLPTDETEPRLHRRRITIEVSPETYDLWRKMHALANEEHGQRLSDEELISALFRRAYGEGGGARAGAGTGGGAGGAGGTGGSAGGSAAGGPGSSRDKAGSPAYKIAIKQCPDCKRAWQFSGGRDIEVDPAVAECAACDAIHLGSLDAPAPERITTTVTARKREQVLARDGYCCTVPGCRRNVGLDLHHIEYQGRGGGHELRNLTAICDCHHKAVHFGKLVIRGTAPDHLTFEFRKPRDRRNVTDDDPPEPVVAPAARPLGTGPVVTGSGQRVRSHVGSQERSGPPAAGQREGQSHVGSQERGGAPAAGLPAAGPAAGRPAAAEAGPVAAAAEAGPAAAEAGPAAAAAAAGGWVAGGGWTCRWSCFPA